MDEPTPHSRRSSPDGPRWVIPRTCTVCCRGFLPANDRRGGSVGTSYCSSQCRTWWNGRDRNRRETAARRAKRRTVPCGLCRRSFKPINGQRYCSSECKAEQERKRERPPRPYRRPPCVCGKPRPPRRRACEECEPPPAPKPAFRNCGWCGASTIRPRFCGKRCSDIAYRLRRHGDQRSISYERCRQCGDMFVQSGYKQWCSSMCAKRARRSRDKHARRTVTQMGEQFTLREIADRDGWRCHICRRAVIDRPYAARDADPTIDHLVPVSDGGEHTKANVRLAHNRCNWDRSTGGSVQLLLVG